MSGSYPSLRSPAHTQGLPVRLAAWLILACMVGTIIAAAVASGFGRPTLIAALLAAAPILVGVVAGVAMLSIALGISGVEAAIAIVVSGLLRLLIATLAGLIARAAAGVEDRPFWFAFLLIMGCVMVSEVAAAYRLLNRKEPVRA